MAEPIRCGWVSQSPLYQRYHDEEWGVPVRDATTLFEFLILEGAQAGLNWLTILQKRAGYHAAFANFDAAKIATFDADKYAELLTNPAIVRNRLKISATIDNAKAWLELQAETDPVAWLWDFVGGQPQINHWATLAEVPAATPASEAMSKALKKRGFRFVGPTICYAFMQAVGMVNDHTTDCFCHPQNRYSNP